MPGWGSGFCPDSGGHWWCRRRVGRQPGLSWRPRQEPGSKGPQTVDSRLEGSDRSGWGEDLQSQQEKLPSRSDRNWLRSRRGREGGSRAGGQRPEVPPHRRKAAPPWCLGRKMPPGEDCPASEVPKAPADPELPTACTPPPPAPSSGKSRRGRVQRGSSRLADLEGSLARATWDSQAWDTASQPGHWGSAAAGGKA